MTVRESDLITGKWYIVVETGQGGYQAISSAFDTYYKACHKASGPDYADDAYIRRWDGTGWIAVQSEE